MDNPKIEVYHDLTGNKLLALLEDLPLPLTGGITVIVPKGYRSDGASVPRFLWRLLSPQIDPVTLAPSIGHDYLYEHRIGSREDADEWYREKLIENGYPKWKARITYYGLRWFGGSHWG